MQLQAWATRSPRRPQREPGSATLAFPLPASRTMRNQGLCEASRFAALCHSSARGRSPISTVLPETGGAPGVHLGTAGLGSPPGPLGAGPHGLLILHFCPVPMRRWCCWSGDHTLGTTETPSWCLEDCPKPLRAFLTPPPPGPGNPFPSLPICLFWIFHTEGSQLALKEKRPTCVPQ